MNELKWFHVLTGFAYKLSELCFGEFPEHCAVYFESNKQHCPEAVFIASPKKIELGNMWRIESLVYLGADCNYTVHVVLRNEAGETNSTDTLTIS